MQPPLIYSGVGPNNGCQNNENCNHVYIIIYKFKNLKNIDFPKLSSAKVNEKISVDVTATMMPIPGTPNSISPGDYWNHMKPFDPLSPTCFYFYFSVRRIPNLLLFLFFSKKNPQLVVDLFLCQMKCSAFLCQYK